MAKCKPDFLKPDKLTGFDRYREPKYADIIWRSHSENWVRDGVTSGYMDHFVDENLLTVEEADDLEYICTGGNEFEPEQEGLPWELYPPNGVLGGITKWTIENSNRRINEFALMSAIMTVATGIGRKVKTNEGDYPNLYTIGVAPSGGGKNDPLKVPERFLTAAMGGHLIGYGSATSASAIVTQLLAQLALILPIDEIGKVLRTNNSRNASTALQEIETLLLKLYSSPGDEHFKPKAFADKKDNVTLHKPFLNFYGMATPSSLFNGESLTLSSVVDGLLGRCLMVIASKLSPYPSIQKAELPVSVVEALRLWVEHPNEFGNVPEDMSCVEKVVPVSDAANRAFRAASVRCDVLSERIPENNGAAIYRRSIEKARKLALIQACSENDPGDHFEIGQQHAEWGTAMVNYLTDSSLQVIQDNISAPVREQHMNEIVKFIGTKKFTGATLTDAYNKFPSWTKKYRAELIDDLIGMGRIVKHEKKTPGRSAVRLYLPDYAPEGA